MKTKLLDKDPTAADMKKLGTPLGTVTITIQCYEHGAITDAHTTNSKLRGFCNLAHSAIRIFIEQMEEEHNRQKTGTPS